MSPSTDADPVGTIARRVKEIRGRRGWTAADLGERLKSHNVKWDRFTVANLENGKRQSVSVVELLALARVLDVSPVNLLVPGDDSLYAVTPTSAYDSDQVRAWVRGDEPLPDTDEQIFFTEVSIYDLRQQRRRRRAETAGAGELRLTEDAQAWVRSVTEGVGGPIDLEDLLGFAERLAERRARRAEGEGDDGEYR